MAERKDKAAAAPLLGEDEATNEAVDPVTGEVVPLYGNVLALPGRATATSLELPDDLPEGVWRDIGRKLATVERSVTWWVGDWWAFGAHAYGVRKATTEAADWDGPSFETCIDAGIVSRKYETLDRSSVVSWTVHRVLGLVESENDRLAMLAEAARDGWTVAEAKSRVNRYKAAAKAGAMLPGGDTCTVDDLWQLVDQGRRFGTVYADPPWLYDNQGTRAATGNHYAGMTVEELAELPLGELAADDAHLHLWVTNAFLPASFDLFDAWGFEFRSSFVWVKPQIGLGNYWRNAHEFLLTAVRGNAKSFADKTLKSWLEADRGRHSAKPEQVRGFIERASPGPWLELFGRGGAEGWTVWGNQVSRDELHRQAGEAA